VIVQTGIINDSYVEILSGLAEGQIVELFGSEANRGGMSETMFFVGGGMGGMGGMAAPAGGMSVPAGGGGGGMTMR
jgi:HlyD family secretion protein